jgi:TonB family protein
MGFATLLAVSLLGAGSEDAGQGAAAQERSEAERKLPSLVVDTSAISPPLRAHGSLDGDKVRQVVSGQQAALRGCYERGLLENPTLAGTCTVRIVIDRNGSVGSAGIHGSSLQSLSMHRCVLQLVRTWRFPPPTDGKAAAIEYPLTFRREERDAGT